jgi:hypothetical protein
VSMTSPRRVLPKSANTALPHLPAYVEHGGEIACRHPADALDTRMYGFVVEANQVLLDAFCDRCFNHPTGGAEHWTAASGHVLLNFVDIPTMGSTDLLDRELGVCHEQEAAIWFPIVDRKRNRFAWAIPYMFVDSGLAMAGGREVYGFPKQLGTLEIPRTGDAPAVLSLDTVTLRKYAPTEVATDTRVVTVERTGAALALTTAWDNPVDAFREIMRLGAGSSLLDALGRFGDVTMEVVFERLRHLLPLEGGGFHDVAPELLFFRQLIDENIPMVLLKQFRDAHQQGAACYQAVIEVGNAVLHTRAGGILPNDYTVRIAELDGEPITRELGLSPGPVSPLVAFWLEFDFLVHLGEILWEAPGARG